MKRILLSFLAVAAISTAGSAQVKASMTAKIKTPNVGCDDCKNRIETYLKRHDGVTSVVVNWRRKETTVKYLTDRINIEEIKTAIANAGYDADDVLANEDSYKRLPKSCKKPQDGGPNKGINIHAPPPPKTN
jgi:periplasmic mercuric ion binding protein